MKWLKLAVLLLLVVGAALWVHAFGGTEFSRAEAQAWLVEAGPWSRVLFIVTYAVLICLTVPGTALTVFGATFFGLLEAYLLVLIAATLGAAMSFGLGRALGRDAVESLLSRGGMFERIQKITRSFESRGIVAVAYLRMAYVPFVVLNYLAPLTGIRFRDFILGTFLGILPGSFVFVFLGNSLQVAWATGTWSALLSWRGAVALGLFLASLGLPWLASRLFRPADSPPQS